MKDILHTTNYSDTFIEVAEDYSGDTARIPVLKGEKKTIASQQYELLVLHPYQFTSDDILFLVFADRNGITKAEYADARASFFSKGQACMRASPLTKTHGFGVHADSDGKIALYPLGSEEYQSFLDDPAVKKLKAMRTSRK